MSIMVTNISSQVVTDLYTDELLYSALISVQASKKISNEIKWM